MQFQPNNWDVISKHQSVRNINFRPKITETNFVECLRLLPIWNDVHAGTLLVHWDLYAFSKNQLNIQLHMLYLFFQNNTEYLQQWSAIGRGGQHHCFRCFLMVAYILPRIFSAEYCISGQCNLGWLMRLNHTIKKFRHTLSVAEQWALSGARWYYRRVSGTVHGVSSG